MTYPTAIDGRGCSEIRRTFGDGSTFTFRGVILKRGDGAVLLRSISPVTGEPSDGWLHIGTHTAPNPRWSMVTEIIR